MPSLWPYLRQVGFSRPSARTESPFRSASPPVPAYVRHISPPRGWSPRQPPSSNGYASSAASPTPSCSTAPRFPAVSRSRVFPCCYALQRPISATQLLKTRSHSVEDVVGIRVRTPTATVAPLIHHRPRTGLEAKFSLEYAVAAALLDPHPGFASFTDPAVRRPQARRLIELVKLEPTPGGADLLAGEIHLTVCFGDGSSEEAELALPPGSPTRPPSESDFAAKLRDCGADVPGLLAGIDWHPGEPAPERAPTPAGAATSRLSDRAARAARLARRHHQRAHTSTFISHHSFHLPTAGTHQQQAWRRLVHRATAREAPRRSAHQGARHSI